MTGEVFLPKVRAAVIAVAVVSAVTTVGALLFGSRLVDPSPHGRDSYGRGAVGHRALVETLEALGLHVERSRIGDFEHVSAPLLVIEPDDTEAEIGDHVYKLADIVHARCERGFATVVVLPKWEPLGPRRVALEPRGNAQDIVRAIYGEEKAPSVTRVGSKPEPSAVSVDGELGTYAIFGSFLQSLAIEDTRSESVLHERDDAAIVRVLARGPGKVLIVADPDLAHSFNVQRGDHAELWLKLIRGYLHSDTVVVDEVFHGHGELPSLGAALGRFPTVLIPLHALLLALLVVWAGLRPFGPRSAPAVAFGRGPSEAIGAGSSVLIAGLSGAELAASYVARVLQDIGLRFGVEGPGDSALAARIDALAARRGCPPRAVHLNESAENLRSGRAGARESLRLARAAWIFRQELLEAGGARGKRQG